MATDLRLALITHDHWTDNLRIQAFIPFIETLIGDNFIPIFGYVRCGYGYGYGYGYRYLGMKKPGIPKMGIGMGIPEPGIVQRCFLLLLAHYLL